MGFFSSFVKVVKETATTAATTVVSGTVTAANTVATGVVIAAETSAPVITDIGTSTTRIVTDTVLDTADAATGFQFSHDITAAKKEMTEAGLLSASDAIAKNHYGFLPAMEREAKEMLEEINVKGLVIKKNEQELRVIVKELNQMDLGIDRLKVLSESLITELDGVNDLGELYRIMEMIDVPHHYIDEIYSYATSVDDIGKGLTYTQLGVGLTGAATGLAQVALVAKAAQIGRAASAFSKGARYARLGKLAGRASGVLMVATIGLDVGLSVVALEQKKEQLEEQIRLLKSDLRNMRRDSDNLAQELRSALAQRAMIWNLTLGYENGSLALFNAWIDNKVETFKTILEILVGGIKVSKDLYAYLKDSSDEQLNRRVDRIMTYNSKLSKDEALEIINRFENPTEEDKLNIPEKTKTRAFVGNYENHLYDDGGKNNWHYITISKLDDTTLRWSNRAGVSWSLTITNDKTKLKVGRDCPYYNSGHKEVIVTWNGNSVTELKGPGNEPYLKS